MPKCTQHSTGFGNLVARINIRFFCWLLLKDRLSTRNILTRKNMALGSYNCVLCMGSIEKTWEHLFFQCPFSRSCWNLLHLLVPTQVSTLEAMDYLKDGLNSPLFMSVIILLCWAIWTTRNDLIFEGLQPTLQGCCSTIVKELKLLLHRVKSKHKEHLEEWLRNFA